MWYLIVSIPDLCTVTYFGYVETFKSLHIEADLLTDIYMSVFDSFEEYQTHSCDKTEVNGQYYQ